MNLRRKGVVSEPAEVAVLPVAPAAPKPVEARRAIVLTPITLRIETLICRLATAGAPMASNIIIAGILNGPGRETVRRSIERLVLAKHISVETKPGMRRVHILAAPGWKTDWGAFVTTGHAPFSLNPRGSVRVKPPVRLDYKPVAHEPFRYRIQPQRLVETSPALTCQWIEPFCALPSVPGFSWCLDHGCRIFPSWDRARSRSAP